MSELPPGGRFAEQAEGFAAEFYAHCARGVLAFQRCSDCDAWRHLPRESCAGCGSSRWEWRESGGRGRVFSWTVTHRALYPEFAELVPYAVAVVELEEGVRMVACLEDIDPARVELDLPVQVAFRRVSEKVALPRFRPR
jgi:uncharacterized OB-fold protein